MFSKAPRVAVVRASGVIQAGMNQGRLNAQRLAKPLRKAFKMRNVKAVALVVNSPGGSPVQSHLLKKTIERLSAKHSTPVYAFVEDYAASGGYFVACGAEKIYADESSLVGSIGVRAEVFGFDQWIEKYSIQYRSYIAGKNKTRMDPFKPEREDDKEWMDSILGGLHTNFKEAVIESRGDRLKQDQDLFNGDIWLGKEAQELGLVDGIGDMHTVMKEVLGEEPKFVETVKGWGAWGGMGMNVSEAASEAMTGAMAALETKSKFALRV